MFISQHHIQGLGVWICSLQLSHNHAFLSFPVSAVCVQIHLSLCLPPDGVLNFIHSGGCEYSHVFFLALSPWKFMHAGLLCFPGRRARAGENDPSPFPSSFEFLFGVARKIGFVPCLRMFLIVLEAAPSLTVNTSLSCSNVCNLL